MTKKIFIIISVCLIQFFSNNLFAVEPDEILKNQEQELRARNISKNIRCMVCQNQSIDESMKVVSLFDRHNIKKYSLNGLMTGSRVMCISEKVINVFKEAGWKNLETFEAGDELIKIGN